LTKSVTSLGKLDIKRINISHNVLYWQGGTVLAGSTKQQKI
jgi:hypothetical protein